jgi:beta-1,4-mannosyl-glycoprotein beta-1,4-N-acetylglucosaminyltransferase
MIYDCFIFNSELELLKLRLDFLDNVVDYFVIVESKRTLSGKKKLLHYKENEQYFEKYQHKIIYLEAPIMPHLIEWDYEYFQRNYIKQGLINCHDNDLILISDVDEIVNLKPILSLGDLQLPALIELPYYNYFLNLKSYKSFTVNLLCKYSFIKDLDIGERNNTYKKYVTNVIKSKQLKTGWHFSNLFGFDIPKYQEKIKSFSHQEFNNPHFLKKERILKCIQSGVDLFERTNIFFSFKQPANELGELNRYIEIMGMTHLIYKPGLRLLLRNKLIGFILIKKILPLIKYKLYNVPRYKLIVITSPFRKKIKKLIFKPN